MLKCRAKRGPRDSSDFFLASFRSGFSRALTRFALASFLLIAGIGPWLAACGGRDGEPGTSAISRAAFDARLRFLASDLLEGRATGSAGGEIAAQFIANQLALIGIRPAVGDSSYFQALELLTVTGELSVSFRAPGGAALTPEAVTDFVGWTGDTLAAGASSGELVFAGYGISAPDLGHDDFKNQDVSGKFLLVLPGAPPSYVEPFSEPGARSRRAHWSYKVEEARRRGAAGVLFAHSTEMAGHGWEVLRAVAGVTRLHLAEGVASTPLNLVGWLDLETVEGLVSMAGFDLETMLLMAASSDFQPVVTGVIASLNSRNQVQRLNGSNVAGFLSGSDSALKREYVVFTAHYDQLGIGTTSNGDSIYNGAYDNASGAALLLGLAEAFARLPQAPRRSLLFLATAAGVKGPLGATAYVREPLVPTSSTATVISLDGVNLWGPTRDIVVWDAQYSTLDRLATAAAIAEGLRPGADVVPGDVIFYPSDHEPFARAGIPSVRVGHGLDFVGQLPEWGRQQMQDYVERHYLRPSDEYRAEFDLRGAVQQGRVAFRLGLQAANAEARPGWKNGPPLAPDAVGSNPSAEN